MGALDGDNGGKERPPLLRLVLRREGCWVGAVLACGPGAALSDLSAAARLELLTYTSKAIHVIAPRSRHPHPGIHLHRARSRDARDVAPVDGIPTTTFARTALARPRS